MLPAIVQNFMKAGYSGISADSREVLPGGLFVAYPGESQDGRDYIAQAIEKGAKGILYEPELPEQAPNEQVSFLAVDALKQQAGEIAAAYFGRPSEQCEVIGVTGTNGKTTVTQWLAQCFEALKQQPAVLGTLGYGAVNALKPTKNTTPDAIVLQSMLAELVEAGHDAVAMEVSSHGIVQERVQGVAFDFAVFTNLSRDHLDYHQTMAAYGAAKRRLLEWEGLKAAIINTDDAFGRVMAEALFEAGKPVVTYGMKAGIGAPHVLGKKVTLDHAGLAVRIASEQGEFSVRAAVVGDFNAANILAVVTTLLTKGIEVKAIQTAVTTIKPVAGRMQQLSGVDHKPLVVVDYAHTPAALETVLQSLKKHCAQDAKLWCVFGCGGNRDQGKRKLMGQAVGKLADQVILTSDNPRDEAPMAIAQDVEEGLSDVYWVELDREQAITKALTLAGPEDVILVAGKGHENYQEIEGVRHPFSDVEVVERVLKSINGAAS